MTSREDAELALGALDGSTGVGEWRRCICPFCAFRVQKEDRKRKLNINVESGYFECFRCGMRGWLEGLEEWEPSAPTPEGPPPALDRPDGWEKLRKDAPGHDYPLEYLMDDRALPYRTIRDARIGAVFRGGYEDADGRWRKIQNRIVVPILDDDGRTWLGWVGRVWDDEDAFGGLRYMYPAGMKRGSILYDRHLLDEETDEPVLVVEGVLDALPYFGRAVAVLGKPSGQHIEMLGRSRRPLAVALDGDAWRTGWWATARRLRLRGVRTGALRLPPKTDPDDLRDRLSTEEILEAAARCIGGREPVQL